MVSVYYSQADECVVWVGYRAGGKSHIVCQQLDRKSVFLVVDGDSAQLFRVLFAGFLPVEFYNFINQDV